MDEKERILSEAKAEADKIADTADTSYKTTIDEANRFKQEVHDEADAYDDRFARRRRRTRPQSLRTANTRAEQIIFSAQQQSQKMVDDSEITRRAQAYAVKPASARKRMRIASIIRRACRWIKCSSGAAARSQAQANWRLCATTC